MAKKKLRWLVVPVLTSITICGLFSFTEPSESDDAKYPTTSPYLCEIWEWKQKPGGGLEYVKTGTGVADDCPKTREVHTCTPYACKKN